ncbi:hypothetical protein B4589_009540 [Halolamina sp. CBA1230]|uniref:hypothetical protein n=1 Tax=Halolamina sp. CBA1230 TaxID=1853690 RepID=UPI0009A19ABE|nr:hypothetical protein [Halolamina sp. CBA1230]QKY20608.1 hypothetical protein B4589_009540 [Halolamina sp. CBA1230]
MATNTGKLLVALGVVGVVLLAGCAGGSSPETNAIDSTANVSVESGDAADCVLNVDAEVGDGELVTIIQKDAIGLADSTTLRKSLNISRAAYQGANVTVFAVNPETENASTLYRGSISPVLAEECGIEERPGAD